MAEASPLPREQVAGMIRDGLAGALDPDRIAGAILHAMDARADRLERQDTPPPHDAYIAGRLARLEKAHFAYAMTSSRDAQVEMVLMILDLAPALHGVALANKPGGLRAQVELLLGAWHRGQITSVDAQGDARLHALQAAYPTGCDPDHTSDWRDDARDAARYRWLRSGHLTTAEEQAIETPEALDGLCDWGLALPDAFRQPSS